MIDKIQPFTVYFILPSLENRHRSKNQSIPEWVTENNGENWRGVGVDFNIIRSDIQARVEWPFSDVGAALSCPLLTTAWFLFVLWWWDFPPFITRSPGVCGSLPPSAHLCQSSPPRWRKDREVIPNISYILFLFCSSYLFPLPTHPHPTLLSNSSMSVFPFRL